MKIISYVVNKFWRRSPIFKRNFPLGEHSVESDVVAEKKGLFCIFSMPCLNVTLLNCLFGFHSVSIAVLSSVGEEERSKGKLLCRKEAAKNRWR